MKSIKPGREISDQGRFGAVIAIFFGILWTVVAVVMAVSAVSGAGGIFAIVAVIFPIFGLLFIVQAIKQARFHKHNATSPDRYSIVDIVDSKEEADPFAKYDKTSTHPAENPRGDGILFCSNCGTAIDGDDNFCPKCGTRIR
jgi:ABC-type transport system involved in cytochrome bd biosynthesis fused ATPase/permease subunit